MSDFSQNGIISTLHDFGTKSVGDIEAGTVKILLQKLPSLQERGLQLRKWPAGPDFGLADGSDSSKR